jgi:hypothetical protein
MKTMAVRALPVLAVLLLMGSIGFIAPQAAHADAPPPSATEQQEKNRPAPGGLPYYYAPGPVGGPEDVPVVGPVIGVFTGAGEAISRVSECFTNLAECFLNVLMGVLKIIFAPFIALVEFTFGDLLGQTGRQITIEADFVRDMMGLSRAIALGLMAVILMWGGFAIMTGRHLGSPYHEVVELLPRTMTAVALIAIFPWLAGFLIDINNALIRAVIHPEMIKATTSQLLADMGVVPMLLFWIVFLLLGVFLAGQLLMRFVILDLLLVTAPFAIMLWVLPQTRRWNELWAALFPATVFQQALQAWTLVLGFRIVSAVYGQSGGAVGTLLFPISGAAGIAGPALLAALTAIAVLLAALKVPEILGKAIGYWQPAWSPILATFNVARGFMAASGQGAAAAGAARP